MEEVLGKDSVLHAEPSEPTNPAVVTLSAGSSDIGRPLCLYDQNDRSVALLSERIPFAERAALALEICRRFNAGWQPMETAPKDRTRVLAEQAEGGVFIVHWGRSEPFGEQDAWATDSEGPGYSTEIEAVRWMPLPLPPTERVELSSRWNTDESK